MLGPASTKQYNTCIMWDNKFVNTHVFITTFICNLHGHGGTLGTVHQDTMRYTYAVLNTEWNHKYKYGLVQDCIVSSVWIPQSCSKPSIRVTCLDVLVTKDSKAFPSLWFHNWDPQAMILVVPKHWEWVPSLMFSLIKTIKMCHQDINGCSWWVPLQLWWLSDVGDGNFTISGRQWWKQRQWWWWKLMMMMMTGTMTMEMMKMMRSWWESIWS